jgi:hypothetical protein
LETPLFSIRLPKAEKERLLAACINSGVSLSTAMRVGAAMYLALLPTLREIERGGSAAISS